jgi:glucose/arabinose dehydrogenase
MGAGGKGGAPRGIIFFLPKNLKGHSTRTFVFGPDGYMYILIHIT